MQRNMQDEGELEAGQAHLHAHGILHGSAGHVSVPTYMPVGPLGVPRASGPLLPPHSLESHVFETDLWYIWSSTLIHIDAQGYAGCRRARGCVGPLACPWDLQEAAGHVSVPAYMPMGR